MQGGEKEREREDWDNRSVCLAVQFAERFAVLLPSRSRPCLGFYMYIHTVSYRYKIQNMHMHMHMLRASRTLPELGVWASSAGAHPWSLSVVVVVLSRR